MTTVSLTDAVDALFEEFDQIARETALPPGLPFDEIGEFLRAAADAGNERAKRLAAILRINDEARRGGAA